MHSGCCALEPSVSTLDAAQEDRWPGFLTQGQRYLIFL